MVYLRMVWAALGERRDASSRDKESFRGNPSPKDLTWDISATTVYPRGA
jgi:hypothetical protein